MEPAELRPWFRAFTRAGWLYITPARIVFTVEQGDAAHAFEVKRTDLTTKPVTDLAGYNLAGVQINLRDKLAASNSSEQKFVFVMQGVPSCRNYVKSPKPITKFLTLAINDFDAAMSEFKQLAASFSQSGRVEQISIGSRLNAPPVDKFTFTAPFDYHQFEPSQATNSLDPANTNESDEIAAFDRIIQLNPQQPNGYYSRALVYGRTGDHDLAIADFNKALELRPQAAVAYNARANAYARKGEYNRALVDYNRAIQLNPQLKMLYYNRGLAFARKEAYDLALADFNKEIELNPQEADVYNARGCVYSYKGDYDHAITDYSEAIRLKPDFGTAYKIEPGYTKLLAIRPRRKKTEIKAQHYSSSTPNHN